MLNAVIIGTGQISKVHAKAMKESLKLNLLGFIGRDVKKTIKIAKDFDVESFPDLKSVITKYKLDLVIVCTPSYIREEIIFQAINKNINVLCEKPFALSYDEAFKISEYAKSKKVKLMIGHVVRFWPAYVRIKEILDKNNIGRIEHIYSNRLSRHPEWSTWHKDPKKSGGGLYDLAIHDLDYQVFIQGEAKSIDAIGIKSETGCYNSISVNINFLNGGHGTVESNMDMKGDYPFTTSLRIMGSTGTIEYESSKKPNTNGVLEKYEYLMEYIEGEIAKEVKVPKYDPYLIQMNYFADCILEDKEPDIVSMKEVLHVLKIIEAIPKSIEEGRRINL